MLQLRELSSENLNIIIFKHNNYSHNFLNQCIKKFLNKLFIKKDLNFMVPKWKSTFVLPYLGKISLDVRTRLRRTTERDLPVFT